METYQANKLPFDCRDQIAAIFADGFTQWRGYFSRDQQVIAGAFAHAFQLDYFFVAVVDGQVVGIVACTDCQYLSLQFNKSALIKRFGWLKGSIAAHVFPQEFARPFKNPPPDTGSIEFVGVATRARNSGVASRLLTAVIERTPYTNYRIEEVADTNVAALALYRKLGFVEMSRRPIAAKQAQKIGINAFVSFQLPKSKSSELGGMTNRD